MIMIMFLLQLIIVSSLLAYLSLTDLSGLITVNAFVVVVVPNQKTTFPLRPQIHLHGTSETKANEISSLTPPPPTPVNQVQIYPNATVVGDTVRHLVRLAATKAIEDRGHFAIAIPGGSILKMLIGDDILQLADDQSDEDLLWTKSTTVAYVNHKCVSMGDTELATHAKAQNMFLKDWDGVNVITLDSTNDAKLEAKRYEDKLKVLPEHVLPRNKTTGIPIFDLILVGVGDDGHVGSLYPNRDEVLVDENGPCVVPVDIKSPPSITLTLPVMKSAKQVVVAACGVSDKYPQGKSDGMKRAICDPKETIQTFPAVGLRQVASWILDTAAASKLDDEYHTTI